MKYILYRVFYRMSDSTLMMEDFDDVELLETFLMGFDSLRDVTKIIPIAVMDR